MNKTVLAVLCAVLLLYVIGITGDRYLLTIMIFGSAYAIYAATLNFTAAYVGQVNLGHAIFFGTGGYVSAYLSAMIGLPLALTIPVSTFISSAAGLLLGFLTLRAKGPFLLLVTALSNLVLVNLVYSFSEFTGGEDGLTGVPKVSAEPSLNYFIFVSYALLTTIILTLILRSRLGFGFKLIREDEDLAEAMGVNVVKYKILAFTISSTLTGLAGSLYAHYLGVVGPGVLSFDLTFQALVMILLGGWGTLPGPLIGAYTVTFFNEYLRALGPYRTLILGIVTLTVVLRFRKGVYGALQDKIKLLLK
ncbi:MAG: branched-chain amino acid ABC transporter permease [Nitrososphaerales archaeon]